MHRTSIRASALSLSAILLQAALVVGCTVSNGGSNGAGGNGGGGNGGGSGNGGVSGNVDATAVGIWQQTVSSGGDFTNTLTGESFTVSQGYSAKLKIRADGSYSFEHYSAGASSSCSSVSAYDKSKGAATFADGKLTLTPSERTLDVHACADSGKRTLSNDPIVFTAELSRTETLIKETTLKLVLRDGPYPLELKLLQLDPTTLTTQPEQPASFQLGNDPPYDVMQGTWAPSGESDLAFYTPETGAFYVPKYNGAEHKWLRFVPGGYEMAAVFDSAGGADSGTCKKDIVYWEKGTATFASVSQNNDTTAGDARFQATEARLVVSIRECDEDDGVKTYDLKPLTSYFKWQYNPGVGVTIGCEYERTPFQFATCTNQAGWSSYRKR